MSLGVTKAMWEGTQRPKSFHQGLQLQSHRDSDVAHKEVELVDVDSIIMDDGTELRNDSDEWTGKLADITVAGAGGLDTGVEDNNTWYQIYAIAKEDGTRNLLLHESKLWAIDTNSIAGEDATQGIRSAVDNSTIKVAQGFRVNSAGTVPFIEAKLIKVGTPTGKIWFTIETNSGGVPSGTTVATSAAFDVARLPTTELFVRFPMKSSDTLSALTTYHLVAQGSWTVSATNYVGWLFLDEIGDLAPEVQVKILRFLQARVIERVGGREPIRVDTRVIAATHRDLETAVKDNHFREDLYFRLAVVKLPLPPLRERGHDVVEIAEHLVEVFAKELGIPPKKFTKPAVGAMLQHPWPGNVRELQNKLKRALVLTEGPFIGPDVLELEAPKDGAAATTLKDAREEVERELVAKTLKECQGNISQAAKFRGGQHEPLSRAEIEAKFDGNGAFGGWAPEKRRAFLAFARRVFEGGAVDLTPFRG